MRSVITEYNVYASIWIGTDPLSDIRRLDSGNDEICHALFVACVQAARALQTA